MEQNSALSSALLPFRTTNRLVSTAWPLHKSPNWPQTIIMSKKGTLLWKCNTLFQTIHDASSFALSKYLPKTHSQIRKEFKVWEQLFHTFPDFSIALIPAHPSAPILLYASSIQHYSNAFCIPLTSFHSWNISYQLQIVSWWWIPKNVQPEQFHCTLNSCSSSNH